MLLVLHLLSGLWRAVLAIPGQEIPFVFEISSSTDQQQILTIRNGEERIRCTEFRYEDDTVIVRLPDYDSELRFAGNNKAVQGRWINYLRKGNPSIEFKAQQGDSIRFRLNQTSPIKVGERYECWFDAGKPDSSIAIAQFQQNGNHLSGTFLTESGDHSYLEGVVDGDSIKLSIFNGFFCRLYLARIQGDKLEGVFYSGNTYQAAFRGQFNQKASLRNPESISTFEGPLQFRFLDADSNWVDISDPRYKNKVLIIQILGSWCPNCLDETAFLADYYRKYREEGLEMIGLSFERYAEFEKVSAALQRMSKRYGVDYPLLWAGYSSAAEVGKKLPGLKNFSSFPTTLYVDRSGKVAKIYSGFSGPATGEEYENYKENFHRTVQRLLR